MSNRLAQSKSLYLRKHAENPINWWYWGDEALSTAKRENKPIFLSIGYSSCHWCTVMEGEAFSEKAIADYLNANFLPIKVDREERPDIDSIYMQALQMMTGQGGWPLNIFLTPDELIPFYGGTYFPVEPRYGRPGFLQVLQSIRRFYDVEKAKLRDVTEEMLEGLQSSTILPQREAECLTKELLYQGVEKNTGVIGANNFGRPSFPMIPYSALALQGSRLELANGKHLAQQRGEELALGGIYDHVGGGFHRYTVDSTWTVPHFEKMLYDNGLIVEYLANLWSLGGKEPAFKRAIALTVQWLKREMTAPEGYFYAAQDADNFTSPVENEPEEGAFYVWSYRELEKLLTSAELEELQEQFTITPNGNFEGKNVLQRRRGGIVSDNVEKTLDKLFAVRYGAQREQVLTFPPARNNQEAKTHNWSGRIPPVTDTKMIVAWNSLMISGLARAYGVFGDESYWELATNAAQFILKQQWKGDRLYRLNYEGEPAVFAQSEDYALFIKALLDLQTNNPAAIQWLENAVKVQFEFDRLLWNEEQGGYYNNAPDQSDDLLLKERSYIDNATPAANGVAISNLVRLALLTENLAYLERAEIGLKAFSAVLEKSPTACPSLFTALDWYLNATLVKSGFEQLKELVSANFFPVTVYKVEENLPENVVGIVCKKLACLEPAQSWEKLKEQISNSEQ